MTEQGNRLGRTPLLKHFRERVISAPEGKEAQELASISVTSDLVNDLISNFEKLLNKIDSLQRQIRKVAKDRIPVHPEAHEVRHALRTLYPGAIEDFIFLDQYIESVEYTFKRNSMDSIELMTKLTGNIELDNRIIDQAQWSAGDGISAKDLAVMTGQYLLCMVANRIMQPYQAPDVQKQAAPKLMPGTESGGMMGQVLIGLAALLLQMVGNIDEVKGLLDETVKQVSEFNDMTTDDIIAQAQAQERDPLIDKYNTGQRPYQREMIVNYADDYIVNHNDTGYEGWQMYGGVESQKTDIRDILNETYLYNKKQFVDETAEAKVMSKGLYKIAHCQALTTNEQLDMAATVLNSKYTADMICCLVMFIGSIPTSQLKLIRFMLSVSANGISMDWSSAAKTVAGRTNQWIAEKIVEPVMHGIQRFWDEYITKHIIRLIDRDQWPDKELYDIIMACTPVDEMIEYTLNGVESLKRALQALIMKSWNRLQVKNVQGKLSFRLLADSKKARIQFEILDKIIELLERGNLCAREGGVTPAPDELEEAVNQITQGLPPAIEVPVDGHPFETFNMEPFETELGLSVQVPSLPPQVEGSTDRTFRVPDCMRQQTDIREALKMMGLSAQLDGDMKHAREVDTTKPNS